MKMGMALGTTLFAVIGDCPSVTPGFLGFGDRSGPEYMARVRAERRKRMAAGSVERAVSARMPVRLGRILIFQKEHFNISRLFVSLNAQAALAMGLHRRNTRRLALTLPYIGLDACTMPTSSNRPDCKTNTEIDEHP